jgi:protein-S-isoprenylcysteine O-methyltransferase Ste14
MQLTIELVARFAVTAAALSQLLAGAGVLVRSAISERPAPAERLEGPVGLVNYAGTIGFVVVGLAEAFTLWGTVAAAGLAVDAVRITGLVALCAAGLLAGTAIATMGRHLVAPAEVRPDTELITTGPFALVRHPLYLSIVLLWAGGGLALLSPLMGVVAAAFVPALYLRARAEEALLVRHFGEAYAAYAARVPMLLPLPRRLGAGR